MIFDHFFDDVKKRLHRLLLPCRHKTYIRRAEDVQDVFWKSYVPSIYVLCLLGIANKTKISNINIVFYKF